MIRERTVQDPVTLIAGGVIVTAVLLAWELSADASVTVRLLLSSPLRTLAYVAHHFTESGQAFAYTGLESLLGLLAATIFALFFGIVCIYYPRIGGISFPLLVAAQVIPLVCLAPMIILVFGPGPSGKVFLSALIAFFPIGDFRFFGWREKRLFLGVFPISATFSKTYHACFTALS